MTTIRELEDLDPMPLGRNNGRTVLVGHDMTRISAKLARELLEDNGWTVTSETDTHQTWTYVLGTTTKSVTLPRTGWTELTLILV